MPGLAPGPIRARDVAGALRPYFRWVLLSLALHTWAAIWSVGYFHADEHFQIIEFANFLNGRGRAELLPVEFHEQIRPWFQPWLLSLFQTANPFTWVMLCRLLSACLGWFSSWALAGYALSAENLSPGARRALVALTALLWFLPALHARHSSESWSGSLMILSAVFALMSLGGSAALKPWIAGALGGLAFETRYQTAFMLVGLAAWLAWSRRLSARSWLALGAGALGVLAACTLLDSMLYGHAVFAPWNYFRYNLILDKISVVDRHPPWDFLRTSVTETWPILGTLTYLTWIAAAIRFPRSPWTWLSLPFFLVHHLIGHKELRFLLPIAGLTPLMLAQLSQAWRWPRWLERPLWAYNVAACLVLATVPAWPHYLFLERLYDWKALHPELVQIQVGERDPFTVLGTPLQALRPPGVTTSTEPSRYRYWARFSEGARSAPGCRLLISTWPPLRQFPDRFANASLFECATQP